MGRAFIERHPAEGGRNALWQWGKAANPLKVLFNLLVITLAKYTGLSEKNFLYRLVGIKVGRNAAVALGVTMDFFFPQLIELGENCVIGFNATILTHEFLVNEWRTGRTKIGKNVLVGANSTLLAGVTIGDNSIVSAGSLVDRDVPPNNFAEGVPVKVWPRGKK